jgi:nucleosome binding factor SPN SPT16 subunit
VPFHISMIKNVSHVDQGEESSSLRINFNTPGVTVSRASLNIGGERELIYLKEITYRSQTATGLSNAFRMIKDLQKRYKQTEADRKEMEDLVEQEALALRKTDKRIVLRDLMIRPALQKKGTGSLEAHMNGFRFTNRFGETVDVLYSNIKHAFYQPCKGEVVIMFHFHLKNGIMIGKKKQKDITFYAEVGETVYDLGMASHNMSEREEIEAEQRERMQRAKITQFFEGFLKKVEEITNQAVEFDMPFPDLSFNGELACLSWVFVGVCGAL